MAILKRTVLPLIIAAAIGVFLSHRYFHDSSLAAVLIAVPADLLLFGITWERRDGTKIFREWWW